MKKFFTFFAAALLSVSLFAQKDVKIVSWEIEDWGEDGELYLMSQDDEYGFYFDLIYGGDAEDLIPGKEYTVEDVYVGEAGQYAAVWYDGDWHYGIKTLSLTKTIDEAGLVHFAGSVLDSLDDAYTFHYDEVKREVAKLGINLPTENRPADNNIEMAGSFAEGTMVMEKIIETGWFVNYDFVNAAADDTFKFRAVDNNELVLCKFIPANGDKEEKWVQAIFKFGNYWQDDTWHGTPCKFIELDLSDGAQYAWMEGMPEPDPEEEGISNTAVGEKAVKAIRNGQLIIIKNGRTFNALGAEVK